MASGKIFNGNIEAQSLVDIIQIYIQNPISLKVNIINNNTQANLWIKNGKVMHAETSNNFGIDAFYELMTWKEGIFSIHINQEAEIQSIQKNWTELVLEAYVLMDEGKLEQKITQKQDSKIIELDFSELLEEGPPKYNIITKGGKVKNYKEILKTISQMDGFIAAALIEATSGIPICTENKENFPLDVGSAYAIDTIKVYKKFLSKLEFEKKIEEIVITLNDQYHFLKTLKNDTKIIIYLILDKDQSTLGMAKLALQELEGSFN